MAVDTGIRNPIEVAHKIAVETEAREIASDLQDLLGQKLVAYAIGDRHPKSIGRYARGEREPADDALQSLTNLYTVICVLKQGRAEYGTWIKQWMLGANNRLGGKAPVEVFHDGNPTRVMGAARAFISGR